LRTAQVIYYWKCSGAIRAATFFGNRSCCCGYDSWLVDFYKFFKISKKIY
jgi:hypothetical protein